MYGLRPLRHMWCLTLVCVGVLGFPVGDTAIIWGPALFGPGLHRLLRFPFELEQLVRRYSSMFFCVCYFVVGHLSVRESIIGNTIGK